MKLLPLFKSTILLCLVAESVSTISSCQHSHTGRFVAVADAPCPKSSTNCSQIAWSADLQMCAAKCGSNKAWCNAFYQIGFNCVMFNWTAEFTDGVLYSKCPVMVYMIIYNQRLTLSNCSQSSTLNQNWIPAGNCDKAIDGNTNGSYFGSSCTHTSGDEPGWWEAKVNVGRKQTSFISSVTLHNRQDCCRERLNNFVISVDGVQCASYNSGGLFTSLTLTCGRFGSTLRIELTATGYLTLCEVYAYGY